MLDITPAQWAALTPALSYILSSVFFETIDALHVFRKYRILPLEVESKANRVSRSTVLLHVTTYHIFLTAGALFFTELFPPPADCETCTGSLLFWDSLIRPLLHGTQLDTRWLSWTARFGWLAGRQFLALAITDAWVFWWHYLTHKSAWLYRNVHSVHHRLYVPFSYGALYNHWADSLFGDNVAGLLGVSLTNMTATEQTFFLALATFKIVEDHAAYELPWSPFTLLGRLTGCSPTYHNIHHQSWGIKSNFSPYFIWWDRIMGTTYKGTKSLHYAPVLDDASSSEGWGRGESYLTTNMKVLVSDGGVRKRI